MIIVFAGPSIRGLDMPDRGDFELRPPVQQGDVYLAAREKPKAIGIIDGYFEGAPSVWHKEILWAMAQGIAVLGASSMGALRAAELEAFGMIGVGAIFEAYRDEELEDDDEVALLHGPPEIGYPVLSLAMVNVRATLAAAQSAGLIDPTQARQLEDLAKREFYKTRTWDSILSKTDQRVLSKPLASDLHRWVQNHGIDQKQLDAQALLARLHEGDFTAPKVNYHFEETDLWLNATQIWQRRRPDSSSALSPENRQSGGVSFMDE